MCPACRCCSLDRQGVCAGDCQDDGHTLETLCLDCHGEGETTRDLGWDRSEVIDCPACGGKGFIS